MQAQSEMHQPCELRRVRQPIASVSLHHGHACTLFTLLAAALQITTRHEAITQITQEVTNGSKPEVFPSVTGMPWVKAVQEQSAQMRAAAE